MIKFSDPEGGKSRVCATRWQLVFKTPDFLKKALQYSINFKELPNEILSKRRILAVYKVLPKDIIQKANESLEETELEGSNKVIEKL